MAWLPGSWRSREGVVISLADQSQAVMALPHHAWIHENLFIDEAKGIEAKGISRAHYDSEPLLFGSYGYALAPMPDAMASKIKTLRPRLYQIQKMMQINP